MSAKTLKSEVAAAAVATSGCGPEGVEVVEGAEVEQAFGRLEHLYAQLPAMEEKGAALARARSAATVDGLAKAAAYRAAELVRADALVTEAEARVSAAEAEGEQAAGEARLALMAAGTQRGLRVGPAQNAEQALSLRHGRRSPRGSAASGIARRAVRRSGGLPGRLRRSVGRMSAAGRLRRTGRSRAVDRFLAVRRPRGSKDSSIYEGLRSLSSPTSDQFRAGASLPAPAPFTSRPPPRAAFLVGMTSSPASTSPASAAPMQPPSPKPRAPSVTQPAHAFMRLRVARESWPKKGHQLALRAPFLATALPFAKVGCACSVFPLIRGLRLVARRGDARR